MPTARPGAASAGEEMERAAKQLQDNGGEAEQQQEEVLNRLQEAREKLNDKQDNVEEQLAREKLAKVAEQLKGLRDRQEERLKDGDRLRTQALQQKVWSRGARASLGDLVKAEQASATRRATLPRKNSRGRRCSPAFSTLGRRHGSGRRTHRHVQQIPKKT